MCLGAIYWSRIGRVYFSVNRRDAAGIEFRDELIYEELAKPFDKRALPMVHVPCDGALDAFAAWTRRTGHVPYRASAARAMVPFRSARPAVVAHHLHGRTCKVRDQARHLPGEVLDLPLQGRDLLSVLRPLPRGFRAADC